MKEREDEGHEQEGDDEESTDLTPERQKQIEKDLGNIDIKKMEETFQRIDNASNN